MNIWLEIGNHGIISYNITHLLRQRLTHLEASTSNHDILKTKKLGLVVIITLFGHFACKKNVLESEVIYENIGRNYQ